MYLVLKIPIEWGRVEMPFFGLFGKGPRVNSRAWRIRRAEALHGQVIKYVTERDETGDIVIGRGGNISVRRGELLVFSSGETLLRAKVAELEAADLLSGDGVVLTAPNYETDGSVRKIIVHFVYYRK